MSTPSEAGLPSQLGQSPARDPGRAHRRTRAMGTNAPVAVVLLPALTAVAPSPAPTSDPWRERLARIDGVTA